MFSGMFPIQSLELFEREAMQSSMQSIKVVSHSPDPNSEGGEQIRSTCVMFVPQQELKLVASESYMLSTYWQGINGKYKII